MKKFIFSIICTLLPMLSWAQEPYAVLSENNTKLTFYYDDQKATRGGMDVGPFTDSDQRGWYEQRDNIEQVAFDDSFANCTTITSTRYWFSKLTKLTTITDINNLNTDNVTDMGYMFWGCSSLTSLDVSNFNTSNVTNMSLMFAACENLASLELGDNFNTSNVTDMSCIFGACESLTSIDVSNFNTANVTNMGSMFSDCSGLTSLDVTGFNTSNATDLSGMFNGCSSLTTLDVTHFDTSNATDLSGMFNGCSSLTSLDVSGFDTSKATNMEIMFGACESLTSLDLSNFNTSNVTQMWKMFSGCSNLAKLDVTGFETSNTTIMTAMFEGCSNLTNLDLRSFNTSNATTMHQMFYHCSGLETIYVGNEWSTEKIGQDTTGEGMFTGCTALVGGEGTTYDENHVDYTYAHIDGGTSNPGYLSGPGQAIPYAVLSENNTKLTFYYDDQKVVRNGMSVGPFVYDDEKGWYDTNSTIETVVFDESFDNCTTITSTRYWFCGLTNLTTITDIDNLKTNNVTDMSNMFAGCGGLTNLDLSGFNTSKVTDMSEMFEKCKSLISLELSCFNTSNVTNMQEMFADSRALTSLDVSSFNTSNVTNMQEMFAGCKSLTSLDVSGFNTQNVTNMSWMFAGCKSLTSLDVSGFDTSNVTDMSDMFAELKGEQISLDLSGFNTSNVTTMKEMFVESSSLMSINLSNFDTSNVTSMEDMFAECQALTSLDISSFNTSNVTNMKGLFRGNPALTAIYAGSEWNTASVTDGEDMFSECTALVGGAGTTYDTNHVDYTYAHIDGGSSNPGYFTASDGTSEASEETWAELQSTIEYGSEILSQAKESSSVDPWMVEELEMFLEHGQEMYNAHEADEQEVRSMIEEINWITTEVKESLNPPSPSEEASEEAWAELHETVEAGDQLLTEAKGASTVEPWALEELENMTVKGSLMYEEHTASEDEVRNTTEELRHIINEVEEMMRQQPQGEALFDGLTAWVSGSYTLNDAFAKVGRETAIQSIAAIVWDAESALTADMLSGIDNPNLLVFVNEASKAPAGVQNVVVNGVAEEIILTDASGNNNFYCPQSFMARSISYSRDFSQTTEIEECRGWETISLPFTVQNITHENHGALVPFGGENDGYPFWLRQLSDNGLARATQIEANKPYLISMPNSIIYPAEYNQNGTVTFSSSNVTVPETSAQSDSYAGVTLTAAFQQVAQGNNIYALNVGETRGEYPEGSVFEQNYRDIRPFQAYTTHTAGARGFISLESLGGGNDDTTGIENFRIKNSELRDSDGFWYSLDGRRLNAKPTKKGVYVKDGRKIVIK